MPRPSKGARLYLKQERGKRPVWIIRDGKTRRSTGTSSREEAEKALAEYLGVKHRPRGPVEATELTVSQALTIYAEDHAVDVAAPERVGYAIDALDRFWGDLPVSAVKAATCRRYVAERGRANATVRRELGVLNAALQFCAKEGHLISAPVVTMPPAPPPKERWLTRHEAAWLLRAARALRVDGRHLAKFILIGLYTGTRKSAILSLRIDQPSTHGGWIDTERGVLYRNAQGRTQTKKRQPPARLGRKLLGHVMRWKASGCSFAVETNEGRRVADIRKGWERAKVLAGEMARAKGIDIDLSDITPHVLRHTCATWTMQGGADIWSAAGRLGMSVETLQRVYGHHHPDFQEDAVEALERRR